MTDKMKTMMPMLYSIIIVMTMMMMTAIFINYLEGDILPDTSPWSFINEVYGYDFVICLHGDGKTNITYPEGTVCEKNVESNYEEPLESTQKQGWNEDDE